MNKENMVKCLLYVGFEVGLYLYYRHVVKKQEESYRKYRNGLEVIDIEIVGNTTRVI